jgi:predicted methyltransferase
MKFLGLIAMAAVVACSSHHETKTPVVVKSLPATIEESVMGDQRTAEFKLRDQYRHPIETLNFFGIKRDMTVVEIWPSGGWYTEILAPYLSENGKYIMADPSMMASDYTKPRFAWMAAHPDLSAKVTTVQFTPPTVTELAPAASVDMILTFRNVHNWEGDAGKKAAFKAFYTALKPGGILGIVDHRAHPKKRLDPKSGYLKEKDVIRWAQAAGFKLEGKSEINANPKDTKDYKEGVWTLPPRLRLGDTDREKYLAIGESDRMTLKFIKPMKK